MKKNMGKTEMKPEKKTAKPAAKAIARTAEGELLKDDVSNYDKNAYEKPSVTVDVCICRFHEGEVQVLLIKRKHPPFRNLWAIPGGFLQIEAKESLESTAARELEEETGLRGMYLEQLKSYGDPDRDPRMRVVTVAYFALLRMSALAKQTIQAADDAKEAGWFSLRMLPKLAFDHETILGDLLTRLVGKIGYTPIAFHLMEESFTWAELQEVYEFILGKKITAPNFRRKIQSIYKLEPTQRQRNHGPGRPAAEFSYDGMWEDGF
jgi:8-oxo-dGTP diphosphatase